MIQEIKNQGLNNNDNYKRLKEIERNLENLNNLGKNQPTIKNEFENIINKNMLSNPKIINNKASAINNETKKDINKFPKQNNDNLVKNKNQGNGLNINYGIFEENKFEEEPKFNVFYEKHDTPFNCNLNDDDYFNMNKKSKDILKSIKYEDVNIPSSRQQKTRINPNNGLNPNDNNIHKINQAEKGKTNLFCFF